MRKLALCFIAVLAIAGCKKTVKGESKRWTSNNQTVDELGVLYPNFKKPLEEQRAKAKAAMDAAEKVEEKKKRISQMSSANNLLMAGFVGQLSDVDATKKKIDERIVEVSGKAADQADRMSAQQAAENAKRVLAQVDATLKKGAPDVTSANIILKKVTADLRAAEENLDKAASMAQDKQTAKTDKATAEKAAADKAAQEKKAAETWTCEFCGTVNKTADGNKCGNCGADRPAATE